MNPYDWPEYLLYISVTIRGVGTYDFLVAYQSQGDVLRHIQNMFPDRRMNAFVPMRLTEEAYVELAADINPDYLIGDL